MHLVVCLKQVVDPEIPPQHFRVDPETKRQVGADLPLVMGNFDGCALEVGLQLKQTVGAKLSALSLGPPSARETLRGALAMGADDARLLTDPAFEGGDSLATARVLAAAVRKLQPVDVVLCGRQASDFEAGQSGGYLAEELGWPLLSLVTRVAVANGRLRAFRSADGLVEVVECELPTVVTITNDGGNVPRLATVRGLIQAGRRQIPEWGLAELGLEAAQVGRAGSRTEVVELSVPEAASECEMIAGGGPAEVAAKLVDRLRDLQLL